MKPVYEYGLWLEQIMMQNATIIILATISVKPTLLLLSYKIFHFDWNSF